MKDILDMHVEAVEAARAKFQTAISEALIQMTNAAEEFKAEAEALDLAVHAAMELRIRQTVETFNADAGAPVQPQLPKAGPLKLVAAAEQTPTTSAIPPSLEERTAARGPVRIGGGQA